VKRKGIFYPVIILFGILVIATLVIIFTPPIFGSMSSANDLGKYAGTSTSGNDTIKAMSGLDSLVIGVYSLPSSAGFVAFVMIAAVVVIIVVFKMNFMRKQKG